MSEPRSLQDHFVVLNSSLEADAVAVTDSIYAELDEKYDGFAGCSLVAIHSFEGDWPTWEIHPAGDELVCLLSGSAGMVLALPEGDEHVRLHEPGSFVVVPKGTWHTARISEPTRMLFITPGEGTENREEPERS